MDALESLAFRGGTALAFPGTMNTPIQIAQAPAAAALAPQACTPVAAGFAGLLAALAAAEPVTGQPQPAVTATAIADQSCKQPGAEPTSPHAQPAGQAKETKAAGRHAGQRDPAGPVAIPAVILPNVPDVPTPPVPATFVAGSLAAPATTGPSDALRPGIARTEAPLATVADAAPTPTGSPDAAPAEAGRSGAGFLSLPSSAEPVPQADATTAAAVDPATLPGASPAALRPAPAQASRPGPAQAASSPAHQLTPALVQLAHGPSGNTVTLRLDPGDLGHVQIRIERDATGAATIQVVAERADTLHLLTSDQPQLHRALDSAGLPADGRTLHFSLGQTGTPEPQHASGSPGDGGQGGGGPGSGGSGGQRGGHGGRGGRGGTAFPADDGIPGFMLPSAWLRAGVDITA